MPRAPANQAVRAVMPIARQATADKPAKDVRTRPIRWVSFTRCGRALEHGYLSP